MDKFSIVIILFGIIILGLLVLLYFINNLYLKRNKVGWYFKNVTKYLSERVSIMKKITLFLNENTKTEEKYIININDNLIELIDIKESTKENLKEIKHSNKLLEKFYELPKYYPTFEKNKVYNELVDEAKLNQERTMYAIETYNEQAKKYNELKDTKLNRTISKVFKINDYEYYKK